MYHKTILANGIRVVSETIPYVKSVSIGAWFGTGSRFEEQDNHGVSHFIEHLMFKGTQRRSAKDIAETVDAVGGQLNAFTAKEYTCYYLKVLDTHTELALDVLSDMLLNSKFDAEDVNREREVVLEEIHMYEDSPDELVHDIHLDSVWSGHALGRNILGTTTSVNNLKRNHVIEYFKKLYTPDNLVIAAAGNITHEKLVELVQQYFGSMQGVKTCLNTIAPYMHSRNTIINKDTEQVHLCLGTYSVPYDSPNLYSIHLLNNIIGGGISSRLFQSIREEMGLAYSIYSYQTNYSDGGLLTVYAGTRPSNSAQVVELILKNLADVKNNGIDSGELQRAKEQLKGSLLLGLESSSSRMSRLGKTETTLNKYVTLDEIAVNIDKVTLESIKVMAEQLFDPANISFTALGPVPDNVFKSKI